MSQMYGGEAIRIVVHEDEWMAKVEVRDKRQILPGDQRKTTFSRYYRSQHSPGVTAGVGLGLTVSRELARAMGGDLTYHHDGEAVFTISFPLVTAPATALV
jgi:K+-sensing histidine kinase KdpD